MPRGVQIFTEKNVPKAPSFHTFVVIREGMHQDRGMYLVALLACEIFCAFRDLAFLGKMRNLFIFGGF